MTDGCVWRREWEVRRGGDSFVIRGRRTERAVVGRGSRIKGNLFSEQERNI
jgi:hypothetical protein